MLDNTQDILSSLPHSPGIYQFLNQSGDIIYIGKSKNLKSRVNSYFSGQQKLNFAKKKMISHIMDIRYIVTDNETESLILENDLIKKHSPKYNVLLKDGKNFLYIKITSEEFPKIIRTRISPSDIKNATGKYFGPYISWIHVSEVLKLLKKVFGYGVGSHNFFKKKWAYTLDTYLFEGSSTANEIQIKKDYEKKIKEISSFLRWNTGELKEKLKWEMQTLATQQLFEEAQKRKLALEALDALDTYQVVRDGVRGNFFVLQVLEKYEKNYLWIIEIENGKIAGYENTEIENQLQYSSQEVMQGIVEKLWVENRHKENLSFILPTQIWDHLADISCEVPELWSKYELLKLCYKNIYEYAHKKHIDALSQRRFTKKNMKSLLKVLWYQQINNDILFECNDISHLSWSHSVASRSVVENGEKCTKKYKKFRIKTLEDWKIDDFWSMKEIMIRRLKELEKLQNYPDLIVIDGGKGQLWAVMKIIHDFSAKVSIGQNKNYDLWKLQIVSIAKREEELFLPGKSEAIILEKDSPELRIIQMLRDEAHRFAISFNRDSRSKSQKKNVLESIPWIWPKTRKKILSKYGSVHKLKSIKKAELEKFLWKSTVENLQNHGII